MVHPCPECGTALAGGIYDGITFSECPQCAGIWFFTDDLQHLEAQNVHDLNAIDLLQQPVKPVTSPPALLACPMCGGAMQQFNFASGSPVVVHACRACRGLWMEHGQLTQMATALESAVKPPTPGEAELMNEGYMGVHQLKGRSPQSDPRIESAAELAFDEQHAATMARYQAVSKVCRVLSMGHRRYGWNWLMW